MSTSIELTTSLITLGIALTEFICIILTCIYVRRIMIVQTKPFQNKKPDYPDKVIELLQAIVSNQQHQENEIKKVKDELQLTRNGGVKPGIKTKEQIRHEELIVLLQKQNELLQGILDTTSGEEKKKLLDKWKQASELINSIENT